MPVPKFIERIAPWAAANGKLTQTGRFLAIALGLLLGCAALLRLILKLEIFDAGPHVVIALTLGVLGTIALSVGLMAAVFYSSRSGADDAVENPEDDEPRDF